MPESVFDCSSTAFYERKHLVEHPFAILWMKTAGPEIWIIKHLPGGKPHDLVNIFADEGTRIIARSLIGVDDPRCDGHQVLQAFACGFQFAGALFHPLFQFIACLLERLLLPLTLSQVCGELHHTGLATLLVEKS